MAIRRIKPQAQAAKAPLSAETQLPKSKPSVSKNVGNGVAGLADQTPVDATDAHSGTPQYEVGYGKPPRRTRFKPGTSGNPLGRPKDAKGLKTIVRETMTAKVPVRTGGGEKKMSRMEAVMHKTVELGMKGNPRALMQLTTLYGSAIPDAALPVTAQSEEELSPTDLALLEELKATWLAENGEKS